jgi:hypothetical protein
MALTGGVIADSDAERCPSCSLGDPVRVISGGHTGRITNDERALDSMDPLELQMHMKNKKYIEDRAEQVLDGSIRINERGIHALRPTVPDRCKRKYY